MGDQDINKLIEEYNRQKIEEEREQKIIEWWNVETKIARRESIVCTILIIILGIVEFLYYKGIYF